MSVFPTIDPVCSRSAAAQGITTVVDARPRDLGGFTVGRVLASRLRTCAVVHGTTTCLIFENQS